MKRLFILFVIALPYVLGGGYYAYENLFKVDERFASSVQANSLKKWEVFSKMQVLKNLKFAPDDKAERLTDFTPSKKHKILVMMMSYKRPIFLSGQILRLMNQTYDNFEVSVSIKGVSSDWVDATFMQEWKPFIEQGRLHIRYDENKEQLSNFLDTVRGKDLKKYDYFCKIDDDDWYAPQYLEDVNKWLNKEENIDISSTKNMTILENYQDKTRMYYSYLGWRGNTICLSHRILNMLFELEKNPAAYEEKYASKEVNMHKKKNEDGMMYHFVQAIGGVVQERKSPKTDVVYGRQYFSATRR